MRSLRTSILAAAVSVVVVAAPSVASADPPVPLASTGYVESGTPTRVLARDAHALATVGVDGVTVHGDGGSVGAPGSDLVTLLDAAHRQGLRAELLVSNYSNRLGDFDPRTAARLLSDPIRRAAVASQLAGVAEAQGWDGVQVDLESLDSSDADGLTAFVQALRADLPAGRSVSIAVMATDRLGDYARTGYQLAALAGVVDSMTLMTYDQHGPGWFGPGPVGALRWQQRCLRAALTAVPASRLDLGVAGYGYTWRRDGTGSTVTDSQARMLVSRDRARAVWHRAVGEWSARLADGTQLWWSDHRSYRLRVAMARDAGLHGVSVWRLGSMDPL